MSQQRCQLFRSLSLLQASGFCLDRSLDLMGRQLDHGLALRKAAAILRSGGSLGQALRDADGFFSSYHQAVIHLGERSGTLDHCFEYLARHEESSSRLRQKIQAQLIYPGLVLGTLTLIVLILGPLLLSHLHLPFSLFWLLLPATAAPALLSRPAVRGRLARWGPVGRLRKVWATSRFLSCWGDLLEQGIPMLQSLQLTAHANPDAECRAAVHFILERLRAGGDLCEGFQSCGYFGPVVTGTIVAGLECGSLDQLIRPLVELYEVELDTSLEAVTSLLCPLCMLAVGGLLLVFLLASAGPLLKMASQL